jgi:hypothetical protein
MSEWVSIPINYKQLSSHFGVICLWGVVQVQFYIYVYVYINFDSIHDCWNCVVGEKGSKALVLHQVVNCWKYSHKWECIYVNCYLPLTVDLTCKPDFEVLLLPLVPIGWETRWAPELVWALWNREKSLASTGKCPPKGLSPRHGGRA